VKRTEIKDLFLFPSQFDSQEITVCGWAKSIRDHKTTAFIHLTDGSCHSPLQVVFTSELQNYADVASQNVGAAFIVKGTFKLTPDAKQPFEVEASEITIEGSSSPDYPLQKKHHSLEFLRTIPHLRTRTNTLSATFRVRSVTAYAIHKFFNEHGFVYAHTPIITTSDCEGAGEMFRVTTLDPVKPPLTESGDPDYSKDFFGKPTSLTVSGQLEAEVMALTFGKVYTFGPTFRAEQSFTARHASEFWMIEPEIAFAELQDDMDLARDMIKFVLQYVMEQCPQEMAFFNEMYDKELIQRINSVIESDFAKVTYTEADRKSVV
jgi:asparaginyl-tRNA synthetase